MGLGGLHPMGSSIVLYMIRKVLSDLNLIAWQALDRQLSSLDAGTSAAAFTMENVLAEVEDLLSYCNDILCTGTPVAS